MPTQERFLKDLGFRVRSRRAQLNWSVARLSEISGVSQRYLAQLESGKGNISVGRLWGLARALQTPLADLLCETQRIKPLGVALLGLRGAGKTTIGNLISGPMNSPFVELDEHIQQCAGLDLADIFALHSESYYRNLSTEALLQLADRGQASVLALPGGIVQQDDTFDYVRRMFTTIWLHTTPEEHMRRVRQQGDDRPMQGLGAPMDAMKALLYEREPKYKLADFTIDTTSDAPEETAACILKLLQD
ncbi:MAG: helix-turn-helix domain-containing protein [Planctomycetes bacterium]|jgi:XRE family aerobic/anaerobic benzoate catabolism transcriptional regulator|nr:helix-turn-helix domain-containing protein [Planctomycetota bacterium]MBT4028098.1 helix-turn-helix domain-containing protein [Planctomycetota bacterium]MBT4560843.1 helix-turn-helix domain-containing protein [Planctomycetota bacterium]MBT5101497.1 helix-turn-helix domain-containing protein [Planctomycetota bacterium]MBT7317600.1 helix-turn-helix domain-containing protein [Planctomycetota bacterium]